MLVLPPDQAAVVETLAQSASTLVLVDAIDLAGAAAALELSRTLRATLALAEPDDIASRQEQGLFTATAAEAARRTDRLVLLGSFSATARSDEGLRRLMGAPALERIVHLDTGSAADFANLQARLEIERVALKDLTLVDTLGALKVSLAGGILNSAHPAAVLAREISSAFENARYGVMAYQPGAVSRYVMFAAMALADSLSKTDRWVLVPISNPPGQSEMTRMALSLTGLPPPVSFARARPWHDHASLNPKRLLADGDIDTVVWISASRRPRPDWLAGAKLVAIDANEPGTAAHHVAIGRAGVDYAAIMEPAEHAGFVSRTPGETSAPGPSNQTAARALADLADALAARMGGPAAARLYDRNAGAGA